MTVEGVCVDAIDGISVDALVAEHSLFSELFVPAIEKVSFASLKDVPEIALFRSVLTQGIEDLFYQNSVDPGGAAKIRREAKKWMMSDCSNDPLSFVSLCDMFLLDVSYLRSGLQKFLFTDVCFKFKREES